MTRFLHMLLAFAALQVALGLLFIAAYETGPDRYLAAAVDKNERLRAPGSPRIVFIGGSGVAFGIDSERVAQALHYEPVNMGLHGGIGLPFILAEARAGLREGDVAVLGIEYELFASETASDALLETLEYWPQGVWLLSGAHVPAVLDSVLSWFGRVVRGGVRGLQGRPPVASKPPYSRSSFNAMGDVVAHRELPHRAHREWNTRFTLTGGVPERQLSRAVDSLERFRRFCEERGVRTVFAFASVARSAYTPVEREVQRVRDRLAADTGLTLLFEPEAAVFDDEDFFDGPYHLNGSGTQRRMDLLIPALENALSADRAEPKLSADRAP